MARRPDPYLQVHPHSRWRRYKRWFADNRRPHPSTGRWEKEDRESVLGYIWWRDDQRCGLCAQPMPLEGAHIEHVVPKKFGFFDLRANGRAVSGGSWRSRLHHLDNLQAAHSYCNKAKGNTADTTNWRHPNLRGLPVAESAEGTSGYLWLPRSDPEDE